VLFRYEDNAPEAQALAAEARRIVDKWFKRDRDPPPLTAEEVQNQVGLGLRSIYHEMTGESLGRESHGTHFHTWNPEKPYHIDYVYAHQAMRVQRVSIEPYSEWCKVSDHAPVVVDIDTPPGKS
jgi:hypothetical protein